MSTKPDQVHDGGATHGWMQAYLPGAGWVDFDPTNSLVGTRNLIRVAVAWDQRSALPLSGTFIGPASSFRSMDVTVSVIEEPAAFDRPCLCQPSERQIDYIPGRGQTTA